MQKLFIKAPPTMLICNDKGEHVFCQDHQLRVEQFRALQSQFESFIAPEVGYDVHNHHARYQPKTPGQHLIYSSYFQSFRGQLLLIDSTPEVLSQALTQCHAKHLGLLKAWMSETTQPLINEIVLAWNVSHHRENTYLVMLGSQYQSGFCNTLSAYLKSQLKYLNPPSHASVKAEIDAPVVVMPDFKTKDESNFKNNWAQYINSKASIDLIYQALSRLEPETYRSHTEREGLKLLLDANPATPLNGHVGAGTFKI